LINAQGREDPIARKQFERLLNLVDADPSLGSRRRLARPGHRAALPERREDSAYSDADPPYRTANALITSPSELMAVTGFDRETYAKIAPYVTVLPRNETEREHRCGRGARVVVGRHRHLEGAVPRRGARRRGFLDIDKTFEDLVEPDVLKRIDGVSEHFC
jgi:hypothetical protein